MPFDAACAPCPLVAPPRLPLRLEGVRLDLGGTTVLDGLDLCLEAGPATVLLGPNGAGKSLTLRVLHGLLAPSAGRVRWGDRPPDRAARRHQVMVFQQPVLLRRSVAANVAFALRLHGVPRAERRARVAEALALAGLSALARRPAPVLSGGERQRLALARAWALRPGTLLLDEPTANLDPAATRAVEDLIATFRDAGTKIVLATHDLGQARRLGDEVVFLNRGRVVERAPAARFFDAPVSRAARTFLDGDLIDDPAPGC